MRFWKYPLGSAPKFWERRLIFLAQPSRALQEEGESAFDPANDNELGPRRVEARERDPVREMRNADHLARLTDSGVSAMNDRLQRVSGTGWAQELLQRRLSVRTSSAVRRAVEDEVAREIDLAHGRLDRMLALAQRSIFRVGWESLSDAEKVHVQARTVLERRRRETLQHLQEIHGITSKAPAKGQSRQFKAEKLEKGKAQSTLEVIQAAGREPTFGVIGRIQNSVARASEAVIEERILHGDSVRNLQRQVKVLDAAIAQLDRMIGKADQVFAENKAAQSLAQIQEVLRQKAGISSAKFNEYMQEMRESRELPEELAEKVRALPGGVGLLGTLRRSLKTIMFGTLGVRHMRDWLGVGKGDPALRQGEIGELKQDLREGEAGLDKAQERGRVLLREFGKKLTKGSTIVFEFDHYYVRDLSRFFGSTSTRQTAEVAQCDSPERIVLKVNTKRVMLDLKRGVFEMRGKIIPLSALSKTPELHKEPLADAKKGVAIAHQMREIIGDAPLRFGDTVDLEFDPRYARILEKIGVVEEEIQLRVVEHNKNILTLRIGRDEQELFVIDLAKGVMYRQENTRQKVSLAVLAKAPEITFRSEQVHTRRPAQSKNGEEPRAAPAPQPQISSQPEASDIPAADQSTQPSATAEPDPMDILREAQE